MGLQGVTNYKWLGMLSKDCIVCDITTYVNIKKVKQIGLAFSVQKCCSAIHLPNAAYQRTLMCSTV